MKKTLCGQINIAITNLFLFRIDYKSRVSTPAAFGKNCASFNMQTTGNPAFNAGYAFGIFKQQCIANDD
jgi:hypothetical protein